MRHNLSGDYDDPKMYEKISVKKVREGNTSFGPTFKVTAIHTFEGYEIEDEVHTTAAGEGLWVNGKQVLGTCQFHGGKNTREAIRRWYAKF